MPDMPLYTWEEIRKHNKDNDCWIVMYGDVVNITDFLSEHPGGLNPILDLAGYDASATFEAIGHSGRATKEWEKRVIGKLDPNSKPPVVEKKKVAEKAPVRYDSSAIMVKILAIVVAICIALFVFSSVAGH